MLINFVLNQNHSTAILVNVATPSPDEDTHTISPIALDTALSRAILNKWGHSKRKIGVKRKTLRLFLQDGQEIKLSDPIPTDDERVQQNMTVFVSKGEDWIPPPSTRHRSPRRGPTSSLRSMRRQMENEPREAPTRETPKFITVNLQQEDVGHVIGKSRLSINIFCLGFGSAM